MCTITIVPVDEGFRLGCNRDERRDRPTALLPGVHRLGSMTAVFPLDPIGPGTWVGVNAVGLAAAILNRTSPGRTAAEGGPGRRSRGCLLPQLLDCRCITEVLERWRRIDSSIYRPYRAVFAQRGELAILTADGLESWLDGAALAAPVMFTSSSLGDEMVDAPRRRLFDRLFAGTRGSWLEAQRRFHLHRWRQRPELSVWMERPDAKTVSYTVIDVQPDVVELVYDDFDSNRSAIVRAA